ncbi:hypothetical protein GDO81_004566 [Engystomops pustulosus]|uniref:C-type lectin domain-containing protein n=1 Tax=Engystomops pustulosus TaxID=76066 RepID=A0AAV6ZZ59_ENGPU|nr:hypothetical protein GDO81_004566 [Engystomops pustulosus]
MRRVQKPKAKKQSLHVVLVIVAVVLKVAEISALIVIVRKIPCNATTEDFIEDLNIPKKYLHAYYAMTDLCAATGKVCELCPLNWDAYNGKCYFFSEDRSNWTVGKMNCELRKAKLVSIENLNEQDYILKHVSLKNGHFWIGLARNGFHWYWETGEEYQGDMSATSEEHQCATYGKGLSAENCFNPNKWICKKNMSRF